MVRQPPLSPPPPPAIVLSGSYVLHPFVFLWRERKGEQLYDRDSEACPDRSPLQTTVSCRSRRWFFSVPNCVLMMRWWGSRFECLLTPLLQFQPSCPPPGPIVSVSLVIKTIIQKKTKTDELLKRMNFQTSPWVGSGMADSTSLNHIVHNDFFFFYYNPLYNSKDCI